MTEMAVVSTGTMEHVQIICTELQSDQPPSAHQCSVFSSQICHSCRPTNSVRAPKGVCIYSHLICYRNIQILLRPTITTTIFCFCLTCLFRGHDARSDWVPEGLPIMNQWTLLVWGFTHQLPMLSPNKQCQNTERTIQTYDQFNS